MRILSTNCKCLTVSQTSQARRVNKFLRLRSSAVLTLPCIGARVDVGVAKIVYKEAKDERVSYRYCSVVVFGNK